MAMPLCCLAMMWWSCGGVEDQQEQRSAESFRPDTFPSRPYTRWWCFSSEIKKKDIRSQLIWLNENGFGGVEIAWLYPLYRLNATDSCDFTGSYSNIGKSIFLTLDSSGTYPRLFWNAYSDWKQGVNFYEVQVKSNEGFKTVSIIPQSAINNPSAAISFTDSFTHEIASFLSIIPFFSLSVLWAKTVIKVEAAFPGLIPAVSCSPAFSLSGSPYRG